MQTYKLGEIAKVFAGSSAPQEAKYFVDGKYPFLRTGDLGASGTTNNLTKIADYINDLCVQECAVTFAKKGTLVFPKSGQSVNTNKKGILGLDSYVVSHLCCIDSGSEITNKFIYYFFCTKNLSDWSDNDAYPSLKLEVIKQIPIPLPPLATQRAIAEKLDKLQSLIDLKKQAITKTDELAKAIFLEMFGDPMKNEKGWEVKKFGEIAELKYGKGLKSEDRSGEGFAVYGSNGIVGRHKEYLVKGKGIVVGRKGSIGELILTEDNFFPIDTTYYIQENKDKYELVFLYYGLDLLGLQNMNKSAAIPGLNREDVYQRDFFLPPLSLQQKFADIITQIEAQKSEHKLALARLEELYQAEMQKSFSL